MSDHLVMSYKLLLFKYYNLYYVNKNYEMSVHYLLLFSILTTNRSNYIL